jgi:hypothetical protein
MRSANVSSQLTEADAVDIWRRRLAGEAQHVLAAAYNVNPGRIAEVLSGKRFPNARSIALAGNSGLTREQSENILQSVLLLEEGDAAEQNRT